VIEGGGGAGAGASWAGFTGFPPLCAGTGCIEKCRAASPSGSALCLVDARFSCEVCGCQFCGSAAHRHWWVLPLAAKWAAQAIALTLSGSPTATHENTAHVAVIGVELVFAVVHGFVRPFRHSRLHALELVLSACLCTASGLMIGVRVRLLACPRNAVGVTLCPFRVVCHFLPLHLPPCGRALTPAWPCILHVPL
jgi:hypothetical protein